MDRKAVKTIINIIDSTLKRGAEKSREDYLIAAEAEFNLHRIEGRNAVYTRGGIARGIIKAEDLLSGGSG